MEHYIAYVGQQVSLGLMQKEYGPLFLEWANRRIGVEGTLMRPPYSAANWDEWLTSLSNEKGRNEVFAILLHEESEGTRTYRYVGHTGMHNARWPDGWGSTGSIIGDAAARQRGCGTEAKLNLLYHGFRVMGLRKIVSSVKAWNAPSLGHLVKCGYTVVGRYRRHVLHEGVLVDEILLEVFPEDWEPIWDAYNKSGVLPKLSPDQRALVARETSA